MSGPRVVLKLATSLDGRIALGNGASQWITGPEARAQVHRLRADADVVLTGVGTVLADDPLLTARPEGGPETGAGRCILDTRLRTPPGARLFTDRDSPVLILCGADAPAGSRAQLEEAGAVVESLNRYDGPHVSFAAAIGRLGDLGAESVLVEAGARIAAAAMRSGLVERIEWFRAPSILGGDGVPAVAALGFERLDQAPMFRRAALRECGADAWETYERAD
ncbi:MAG: RibD family protein [Maricaulaceae bacterium]|nr:RibD family protein [Maricaulaceae bacterium]